MLNMDTWRKFITYLHQVASFWGSVLRDAIVGGIFAAIGFVGIEFMINLLAYLYALYLGESPKITDYYGPHYFDGAKIFFLVFFVAVLLHSAAQKYRKKELDAAVMSLEDIHAEPYSFTVHGMQVVGLKLCNQKPIDIYDVELQIAEIWCDGIKDERQFITLSFGGNDNFISTLRLQTLSSTRCEIAPVAIILGKRARIAIQPEIYIETDWSTGQEVIKNKEDRARHFYLKLNKVYEIRIRMNAVFDRNYPAKAKIVFVGNLRYDGEHVFLEPRRDKL
jgi:hypothetical protein